MTLVRIHPSGPLGGYIVAPPSKNYSTRLILGASLAEGTSTVRRPAANDDARALVSCCRSLGASIKEIGGDLRVTGFGGRPRNPVRLNPGNAGAVLRLLLGTACLVEGEVEFVTEHMDSLGKRPNEDLLKALRQLGAEASGTGEDGRLPIRIAGGRGRVRGGAVRVSGRRSSQFLSSLLYLCPFLDGDSRIDVGDDEGEPVLVSAPLIDQTQDALGQFGVALGRGVSGFAFNVPGNQAAKAADLAVNGDWPSAAALMACVAAAGGMATVYGLRDDAQGERRAADCLGAMGCKFMSPRDGELMIHSTGELTATSFNGDLATDAVLVLIGAACLAEGTSRFENIGNLRLKESDRIREPLEELAKLGVGARSGEDWIEIDGNPDGYEGGVEVDSRGDHRVAQMLAIVGTRCRRGLTIARAEHISKSYPDFFADLARLGVKIDVEKSA
ncbi:MAG: 3-phosphoshikimate 1-carboxyvinyltransferase [Candidatus Sumerlaeia bacterium]